MTFIHFLKKPEYFLKPSNIIRKIVKQKNGVYDSRTGWGNKIEINAGEVIGRSIAATGIHDLCVSEILWQLAGKGDIVLDIGANIGYMSQLLSHRVGKNGMVYSFEPNPLIIPRLKKNISLVQYPTNIHLYTIGLSDKSGSAELVLPDFFADNEGVAFISEESGNLNHIRIHLDRLDNIDVFADVRIKVAKLDIEGHELKMLQGANRLLNEGRIENIVYEDHQSYPSEVSLFLQSKGYVIFRIEKGWFNIRLTSPEKISSIKNTWDTPNYLAVKETDKIFDRLSENKFYQCL